VRGPAAGALKRARRVAVAIRAWKYDYDRFHGLYLEWLVIPAKSAAMTRPMPLIVIIAALGSITATALLTWVLWRLNRPDGE
jgi:hypothetical protein